MHSFDVYFTILLLHHLLYVVLIAVYVYSCYGAMAAEYIGQRSCIIDSMHTAVTESELTSPWQQGEDARQDSLSEEDGNVKQNINAFIG